LKHSRAWPSASAKSRKICQPLKGLGKCRSPVHKQCYRAELIFPLPLAAAGSSFTGLNVEPSGPAGSPQMHVIDWRINGETAAKGRDDDALLIHSNATLSSSKRAGAAGSLIGAAPSGQRTTLRLRPRSQRFGMKCSASVTQMHVEARGENRHRENSNAKQAPSNSSNRQPGPGVLRTTMSAHRCENPLLGAAGLRVGGAARPVGDGCVGKKGPSRRIAPLPTSI
jgi:hypothetical protein